MAKHYRSLIGGALGEEGFEVGDLIPVPPEKEQLWLSLGLIEAVNLKQGKIPRPSEKEMAALAEDDTEDTD